MPTETDRFTLAAERAVARVIDGDAIVIDTITGRYYSLEGTSEAAWTLLIASHSIAEVATALRARYDTGTADVVSEVARFAEDLLAENLLLPAPDATAGTLDAPAGERAPYLPPTVTIFRDMEDLLAFDPPLPATNTNVWSAEPDAH